jgi:glutamine amidotransferase-like uncharacterized protein
MFDGGADFDGEYSFDGFNAEIFKGTETRDVHFGFTINSSAGFGMNGTLTIEGYTLFNGSSVFNGSRSFGKINITEVL